MRNLYKALALATALPLAACNNGPAERMPPERFSPETVLVRGIGSSTGYGNIKWDDCVSFTWERPGLRGCTTRCDLGGDNASVLLANLDEAKTYDIPVTFTFDKMTEYGCFRATSIELNRDATTLGPGIGR